ncbi:uncharacterized protein LOC120335044 isoform X2 [Styela clava]
MGESSRLLMDQCYTYPDKIGELEVDNDGKIAKMKWKPPDIAPTHYILEWWTLEKSENKKLIKITDTMYYFTDIRSSIEARVAVANRYSIGEYSETVTIHAAPQAPVRITAENTLQYSDPAILVKFDPADDAQNQTVYHITVVNIRDEEDKQEKTIRGSATIIQGISPCEMYQIAVTAERNGLTSPPCVFPHPLLTVPGEIQDIETNKIKAKIYRIEWRNTIGVQKYVVQYREEHEAIITIERNINEIYLRDLKDDTRYEFRVLAQNDSGKGPFSRISSLWTDTRIPLPADLEVCSNQSCPETEIDVEIIESDHKTDKYTLLATHKGAIKQKIIVSGTHTTVKKLDPCKVYVFYAHCGERDDVSLHDMVKSTLIWTAPGQVQDIVCSYQDSNSYKITWKEILGSDGYEVKYQCGKRSEQIEKARNASLVLKKLEPGEIYTIQVRAKSKSAYGGKYSDQKKFKTAPRSPSSVKISANKLNPATKIDVEVTAPGTRRYKILLKNLSGGANSKPIVTAAKCITVPDLIPSQQYQADVCCIDDENDELRSDVTTSNTVWTGTSKLHNVQISSVSKTSCKVTWEQIEAAESYKVKHKIKNSNEIKPFSTKDTQLILKNLSCGNTYEIQVFPVSARGEETGSDIQSFTTAPVCPENLTFQCLGTNESEVTWKPSHGASKYEVVITNENDKVEKKETTAPSYEIKGMAVNWKVSVSAINSGGNSDPAELKFKQVLTYLKKKFQESLKVIKKEKCLHVNAKDQKSGKEVNLGQLDVKPRDTYVIHGIPFAGKTVLCGNFMESLKDDILGLYFDFNKVTSTKIQNLKNFFQRYLEDLSPGEMTFVMGWLKSNSGKIALVLDNVAVNNEGNGGPQITLIQSFLCLIRKEIPQCRTLITTNHRDLYTKIEHTKAIQLLGFSDDSKQTIIKNILGNKHDPDAIPEQTKLFLCNPGLCYSILQMISQEIQFDVSSTAAVFIHAMEHHLSHYPEEAKTVILSKIAADIKRQASVSVEFQEVKPNKGGRRRSTKQNTTSTSVASYMPSVSGISLQSQQKEQMDCFKLYEMCIKALHAAYFVEVKQFEKHFPLHLPNSTIGKMISGLLRQTTSGKAITIMKKYLPLNIDKIIKAKCEFLQKFITKHQEEIKNYVYTHSKITLDWITCCIELGDLKLLSKCCPKEVEVKNKFSNETLDQVQQFIKKAPREACNIFKVKVKKGVGTSIQADIDSSVRQNGNEIEVVGSKTGSRIGTMSRQSVRSMSQASTMGQPPSLNDENDAEKNDDISPMGSTNTMKAVDAANEQDPETEESVDNLTAAPSNQSQ